MRVLWVMSYAAYGAVRPAPACSTAAHPPAPRACHFFALPGTIAMLCQDGSWGLPTSAFVGRPWLRGNFEVGLVLTFCIRQGGPLMVE